MSIFTSLFPSHSLREVKRYRTIVEKINALEPTIQALSVEQLKEKTAEFKKRLTAEGGVIDAEASEKILSEILPEAFAVVREASRRTLGQRHHDVQLIGGMILHEGKIAEMKTGEGKTLMATLAGYLNAISGKGVHVITVNDYLARRDAVWMGQIYHALGLSVGVINHDTSYIYDPSHITPAEEKKEDEVGSFKVLYEFLKPASRIDAYKADLTYGTNNEYGFDYLRDNIEHSAANIRQRDFNFAIIDEVDSILIDESRTPLIISMPVSDADNLYEKFAGIANKMKEGVHYNKDEKFKSISMTDAGIDVAEKALNIGNIYSEGGIKFVHHLETAVRAKAIFLNEVDYIVKDNEVIIVDPATGRLQPGRRWSEGLHQAIEAKEKVKIQQESRAAASITFQNYFRLYKKLCGMTGTAKTSAEEFLKVYGLDVIEVPTHKAIARIDRTDLIFQTEKGKFKAIAAKIKELNKKGQPVLVGTVSIEKNQLLSDYLKREGVPHTLLNAKPEFAEREGETIAQAGKKGGVTISTNMAGRGVDIKLGGAPGSVEEYESIKAHGGLFVLGTERHEARRIDNQLRGRAGRQGDPGETQFYVSLEDDLMRVFATDTIKNMMGRFGIPEDEPIQNSLVSRGLESAQSKIEGFHFDSRKHVLDYDDVLSQQRKKVYERRRALLVGDSEVIKAALDEVLSRATEEERTAVENNRQTFIANAGVNPEDPQAGERVYLNTARAVMLQSNDFFWTDHLELMDYTRSSVNLRAYGQRDPLVEYRKEGLRLFKEMEASVDHEIVRVLGSIRTQMHMEKNANTIELHPANVTSQSNGGTLTVKPSDLAAMSNNPNAIQNTGDDKIGRNDLCPCGSGKKWKKCGMLNTPEHQQNMVKK